MQETVSQPSLLYSKVVTAVLTLPTVILLAHNVYAKPIIAGMGSPTEGMIPAEKVSILGLRNNDNRSRSQTPTSSQALELSDSESSTSQTISYQCDLYSPLSNESIIACQGFEQKPPSTLEGASI